MIDAPEPVDPAEPRRIRICADYSSDGIWWADLMAEDLPVPQDLKDRLAKWCAWYETSTYYAGPEESDYNHDFNVEAFSAEGFEIAKAIKKELPHWSVWYFDEARHVRLPEGTPKARFEYELPSHHVVRLPTSLIDDGTIDLSALEDLPPAVDLEAMGDEIALPALRKAVARLKANKGA